jgi:hypothetical protein
VHEGAEDLDEEEGGEEGEQQEEEEGDTEGEQTSRGYVVTGFINEGEGNPEVMRYYQRELEADDMHWKRTLQMMIMIRLRIMFPGIGRTTISHSVLLIVVNVPWEYTENEVTIGVMYPSTAHVKDAVKQWSILTVYREFRVVKGSLRIYDVCCKRGLFFSSYAYMRK